MGLFFVLIFLILLSIFINILIWKIRIPKNQSLTITLIYVLNFIFFFYPIYNFFLRIDWDYFFIIDFIQVFLFYFLFLFAFIVTYTSIEKDSPSVILILSILNYKKNGLVQNEIYKFITNKRFIEPRIDDLLKSKLVVMKNDCLFITKRGKLSLSLINFFQLLVNQKEKSG